MKTFFFRCVGIFVLIFGVLTACKELDPAFEFLNIAGGPKNYVVVMSNETYQNSEWYDVAQALVKKHNGGILIWEKSVEEVAHELALLMPKHTAFVMTPQEATHEQVVTISRMCRNLDTDPFFDTFWGIVTAASAEDALRIAEFDKKVIVKRVLDATGRIDLNRFETGACYDEFNRGKVSMKQPGQKVKVDTCAMDNTKDWIASTEKIRPQLIATSAHATQHDWDMGYRGPNMKMKHSKDQLYCQSVQGKRYKYNSDEPKVYIASGNCLIGNIDTPYCMATAWMHSGGAHQFIGYTVPTWFGEMGWGTLGKFTDAPSGFYTANEAFHFSNTDIIQNLIREDSEFVRTNLTSYDVQNLNNEVFWTLKKTKMDNRVQTCLGRLFDRDVVAFYGDPAQEFRLSPNLNVSISDNTAAHQLRIIIEVMDNETSSADKLYVSFPRSLNRPKVIKSSGEDVVLLADNFMQISIPKKLKKGHTFVYVIEENTTEQNQNVVVYNTVEKYAKFFAEDHRFAPERIDLICALFKMKANFKALEEAMSAKISDFEKRLILASLVYATEKDLETISAELLIENAVYANKAWTECPWKAKISFELFRDYILPYACVDEERATWRKLFYEKFAKEAFKFKTPGEAALYLNQNTFKNLGVTYHATKRPKPCQSPRESIEATYASCTGLSIILADALRACAIPARFVGVAVWTDRSGNHNWVEYWDDQWIFEGASPSDPRNRDWVGEKVKKFTDEKVWHNSVVAVTRKPKDRAFIKVWAPMDCAQPGININATYTNDTPNMVLPLPGEGRVLWVDVEGEPYLRLTGEGTVNKFIPSHNFTTRTTHE